MLLSAVAGRSSYAGHDITHPHENQVADACQSCQNKIGVAHGSAWLRCVLDDLLARQKTALQRGDHEFFPIEPHELEPLRVAARSRRAPQTGDDLLLKNLIRNFTCEAPDGGSQPLRSMTWSHQPADPCASFASASAAYRYTNGYLPAGDELNELTGHMSEEQATKRCDAHAECAGFTFSARARRRGDHHTMYFKSAAPHVNPDQGWHTFKVFKRPSSCGEEPAPPPLRMRVDVLRDRPPVLLVHDFVSEADCDEMVNATLPSMQAAVVHNAEAGTAVYEPDAYRRSASTNMFPDFDNEAAVVTRLSRRLFAFAREVGEYTEASEGPAQEPINAVYYRDPGDQYRPHCDGECTGSGYERGRRIATALNYCRVAERGGYTSFTRAGLKVVPRRGQMLFFGYKLHDSDRMDDGQTEHSGCPLREGSKWVATQWFRDVDEERPWHKFAP